MRADTAMGRKEKEMVPCVRPTAYRFRQTPLRERGSDSIDIQKKPKPQSSVVPALSQPDQAIVLIHRTIRSDEKDLWDFVFSFPF